MASRRKGGLGRGLDALIPQKAPKKQNLEEINPDEKGHVTETFFGGEEDIEKETEVSSKEAVSAAESDSGPASVKDIPQVKIVEKPAETKLLLSQIEPNRSQPRKYFDDAALEELADSIRQYGLLQPILVQKRKDYYEIIAGERRWRASMKAGLKEVPVIIRDYTDQEVMELSLIENLQREDLNPMEEARAYRRLSEEFGLTQEEIAGKVSKSRSVVANSMRLLKLDDRVQEMVIKNQLTAGHARALAGLDDGEVQYSLAQQILENSLSVRETENLIKNLGKTKTVRKKVQKDASLEIIYRDIEKKLKSSLGTKVAIRSKGDKTGRLEIDFYSTEDLDRIIEKLSE